MFRKSKILVVARDRDLRNSLCFLLEAEGYDVHGGAGAEPDCAVVDIHDWLLAPWLHHLPAVVLVSRPDHPLLGRNVRTVLKPLLGQALAEALRQMLGQRPRGIPVGG